MTLGERLKQLRQNKNLLQKDVADYLNISKSAYGYYEQGRNEMDILTLVKLADLFDVSIDYLVGNKKEPDHLTDEERDILSLYRALPNYSRAMMKGFIMAYLVKDIEKKKNEE